MRVLLLLVALTGCGAVTHPRYAPELARRWPECERIVVVPGTIRAEIKNYRTADFFQSDDAGRAQARHLAFGIGRVLRDEGRREPRISAEAVAALGGDEELSRRVADRMLEHARAFMARDPGHESDALSGLAADPDVVPEPLRRGFDAIVVIGGRARWESDRDRLARFGEILVRNAWTYPLLALSVLFPPALPFSIEFIMGRPRTEWIEAPNEAYFQLAVFDAASGRLLYANDWWLAEKATEPEDLEDVARDLLGPLLDVRPADDPPLGEKPRGWRGFRLHSNLW